MTVVRGSASDMATAAGADGLVLSSGLSVGEITNAAGVVSWSFGVGQVPQFTLPVVDVERALSKRGLLREGVTLTADGDRFEVAAVERDYRGDDIWLSIEARDWLSRRLRRMMGPDTQKDVTPRRWIESRVKRAGGVAVVQGGSPARTVHQKREQSVLAVIEALASDTGVQWVSHGGTLYCGTGWWALQGGPGLPTWAVRPDGDLPRLAPRVLECVGFTSQSSPDSRESAAEASLTVVAGTGGRRLRPWHLVDVQGADDADEGIWLVREVSFDEVSPSVSVTLERPLKSSPKKGSGSDGSVASGGGAAGDIGSGPWIDGADKVWPLCTRSPRQYVAWAQSRVGTPYENYRCLRWVSEAVYGAAGRGGDEARMVWENAPASAAKSPGDTTPPIGAIVVWGPPTGGGAGHIGISIGGGKMISATGGAVGVQSIAGFGSNYYGAMSPSFWR